MSLMLHVSVETRAGPSGIEINSKDQPRAQRSMILVDFNPTGWSNWKVYWI